MSLYKLICLTAVITFFYSANATATDARAIALGGSAISLGQGTHGVWANPATLLYLRRKGESSHLRLGLVSDVRDPGEVFETVINNQDIVMQITNSINALESDNLLCLSGEITLNSVCLENTQAIGEDFQNLLDILGTLNQRPFEVLTQAQLGYAATDKRIPFAIHFNFSAAAAGEVATTQNDIDVITIFQDALIDGELTLGDINNSNVGGLQILSIDPTTNNILEVNQPQDLLTSAFGGTLLLRQQIGISLGYEMSIGDTTIDFGITPKISTLTTKRASNMIASEFDVTTPNVAEIFRDSEINTTTFTIDAGATFTTNDKFAISIVARNLIPERADTNRPSFTINTTPQAIVGATYQYGPVTFNADASLNTAELDGVITRPFGIGAELGRGNYSLRVGGSIDTGRITDKAAFNLGFGLGPLQVGARVSSLNAIQAGAQLSYSF